MVRPIKKPAFGERVKTAIRALRGDLITDRPVPARIIYTDTRKIETLSATLHYGWWFAELHNEEKEARLRQDLRWEMAENLIKSGAVKISGGEYIPELQAYEYRAELHFIRHENMEGKA